MSERELILSVSIKDCVVQHFAAGGAGGQNQNKRHTGTRVIHEPSGARGECREERSQLQNTKRAFHRLIHSPKFRLWMQRELGGYAAQEAERLRQVEASMRPANLRIEVRSLGHDRWIEEVEAGAAGPVEGTAA